MDSLRARRWWARGSLALVTLAFVLLLAFAGRRGLWLVLLTVADRRRRRGRRVLVPAATGRAALAGAGAGRRRTPVAVLVLFAANRLLWVAVVAAALLVAGIAAARIALRPDRSEWTLPVAAGTGAAAAVPDHEPALGRRQGRPLRPAGEGRGTRRRGGAARPAGHRRPAAGPRRPRPRRRPARRRRRRRHPGAGGAGRRRARRARSWSSAPAPATTSPSTSGWTARTPPAASTRCATGWRRGSTSATSTAGPFVNNASFGAYAEIVESPAYRDDKRGTTLDALPDLLSGRRGAHLVAEAAG